MRIEILDGRPFKRGLGRVDDLLRHGQPLTLAFAEAKKQTLPPTQGLEQVKDYARRFAVKLVYSTNGHQFVEHDVHTGPTSEPQPMARFPTPGELRERWFQATGLAADAPVLAPPLTAYHASGDRPRYYRGAAAAPRSTAPRSLGRRRMFWPWYETARPAWRAPCGPRVAEGSLSAPRSPPRGHRPAWRGRRRRCSRRSSASRPGRPGCA